MRNIEVIEHHLRARKASSKSYQLYTIAATIAAGLSWMISGLFLTFNPITLGLIATLLICSVIFFYFMHIEEKEVAHLKTELRNHENFNNAI